MTTVPAEDGSTIVTDLPADKVADLQPKVDPAAEPVKPADGDKPPVEATKTEEPKADPAKQADPLKEPEGNKPADPAKREPKKATPFQTILQKKHDAEVAAATEKERADKAEKALQDALNGAAPTATSADIEAIFEEFGVDAPNKALLTKLVAAIHAGVQPQLPPEVQDLIAQSQSQKKVEAAETAYKGELTKLTTTFKDEAALKNPEALTKLRELATSTDKAPDGEPYFQKPLFELYMNFVKPEFEPGKVTVEPSRGGAQGAGDVMDFEQIHNDEAKLEEFATNSKPEQWAAYTKWRDERAADVPIRRQR